tara:strand:+ start:216 stop:560 length:345 start_codon:yes stop_codon:yes gene_type:complete
MITDIKKLVKFHLKNLILTNPGEKISDIEYGIGARKYLFEQLTPGISNRISDQMSAQIERYLPYIDVEDLTVTQDDQNNSLNIELNYSIPSLGVKDAESVKISGLASDQTDIPF